VHDLASPTFREELADGLVRRWSTDADVEPISTLLGATLRRAQDEMPNPRTVAGTHLLMQSDFPYMSADDAAIVEDPGRDGRAIVASVFFWRHAMELCRHPVRGHPGGARSERLHHYVNRAATHRSVFVSEG
jgi:hypothetical protein